MGINYFFTNPRDFEDLIILRDFLHVLNGQYPRYKDWVENVCIPELENGCKTAVIVFYDRNIVGCSIHQPHKELPGYMEWKNMRIHPELRDRGLASLLSRTVEVESIKRGFNSIICDTHLSNRETVIFLLRKGYRMIGQEHLYDKTVEAIFVKNLKEPGLRSRFPLSHP